MLHRRSQLLGGLLVATLIVTACQGTTPSGTPSATGVTPTDAPSVAPSDKTLTWASRETVDAAWATETDDAFLLTLSGVGETLIRAGFNGEPEPFLATEWSRTGDLTWEFTLREGVAFHDGTPMDADAVAAALTYLLNVDAPARSFNATSIASVEASGDAVVVTSTGPNALVPLYVASPNTVILAAKAYTAGGIDPTEAGTGPFAITAQNLPQGFTLTRNDNYWGGEVALAGINVQLVPDGATRATLLQTGEADIASTLPIPTIPLIEANGDLTVVRGQLARTNSLYMNNSRAPTNDVKVRQAIQAAIDVDAIANQVLEGAVAPASGPFAATAAWSPDGAAPITLDVDRAKSLLAEAGFDEGELKLSLWTYAARAELPDVAVAIQGMLADAGIVVEIRVADYAAMEADVLGGNYDLFLLSRGYLTDINDPAGFLRADYTCAGTYNLSLFCDEAVDAQLEAAVSNEEPSARYAIYADIAAMLQENAVDVFLYNPQELAGTSSKVQNFKIHPMEHYLLTPELTIGD
ncbi:MAG: putative transporter substrate-binding protein [Chloroflexi bacterium]|nr:putative transporter substrate-binding protein [Chloroflexota bacterium]